ncbi:MULTISPECIES: cytochrome c oxidase subunit I [unclassified Mesorhizobium]|uniref:cytochrome c oxidase subunit I n=1 Tax=unclassified Mesorhizobium TaxID=325217 RepID=UPI0007ECE117|nr:MULTISPECIES: cytochrome c oxidase subunit I [unclassified Mesorhizobium]RUZ91528.1 cytochrome c oxidase subunit I [Mesorhizobium sp. M7A.F.Ca.US.003.02.2.1]ARP65681.1 cytochrome c oxidase subunit I [Mesorhizobium sp. WSM1497]RUY91697.1 cytochrome c oxidase subunit I [Mesorhizobium sp. M7A.F.Ca.CA.001.12.2.1]RUZ27511.1 cytochrome c oxidase subunit I [Mesorhizobium sp. M7A.F.Ca.US.007.01.2.1]RUZ43980.1 cytochrome c oxidase subunit I [Mesorhizobium sp. M7A.F.Ca.US.003.02.1.1]
MTSEAMQAQSYLEEGAGPAAWLLTTDHKRVAWLYLVAITGFFFLGGAFAVLMRIELASPAGDLVSDDVYNRLFSLHGIIMVWFFLVPSIPATLGNFLLPLMIGARDLAFPRLNLASWYVFIFGSLFAMFAVLAGGVDTGWTFYTPLSSIYSDSYVSTAAFGVLIVGFSSIMTGINFIVTVHKLRAPGLTWFRLPIFVWTLYATALVMVLATPVLAASLILIVLERVFGLGIFDPDLGGDPLLFQHLFWFYSHPAVYIMILPGMGVVSEVIPCFARRPLFGYKAVALCSMAIAIFGFLVWGHHMFVSGQSAYAGVIFSFLSFIVAIPSAIKVFNWGLTLRKGEISFETPMLFALFFIALFTFGGLAGLFVASLAVDVHLHDTYFVIAHFHYIMVGGMVMAFMGGMHFWWPKMTGRMYSETAGRIAAAVSFVGFNLTFFPQYVLGFLGMPRRYHTYPPEFQFWHVLSSAGAVVLAIGYLMPLFYLTWSLFRGRRAPDNPWGATGLEWQTSSPPPPHNFAEMPVVTRPAYDYPMKGLGEKRTDPAAGVVL